MDDSKKIRQLTDFEKRLSELLSDQQRQHVVQLEELMELAGDASTERELERYLDAEIIIEDLGESSSELHGFLRGIEAAIHARNKQLKEPFRDEFLIRQFIKLPTTVQRSVAEGFWEVDPAIAQILNRILDLAEQEKSALVLWLEHVEKLAD
jgi:hypothetical protein